MILSLRDILVVCDMDGTLLADDMSLPGCNLETIRLFTRLGGRFTVASGRIAQSIERYGQLTPLLAPGILYNGCVLYDFAGRRVLHSEQLPPGVGRRVLEDVMSAFPTVGVMVFAADGRTYLCNHSYETDVLLEEEKITCLARPAEDLPDDWIKIIFAGPAAQLAETEAYVGGRSYPGVHSVMSSPIYYEILPENTSKGSALGKLCGILEVAPENTIAIGDYYNDTTLFEAAGRSVAMLNAPADIRMLADETAGNNNEGGVGQFLYKLISIYG